MGCIFWWYAKTSKKPNESKQTKKWILKDSLQQLNGESKKTCALTNSTLTALSLPSPKYSELYYPLNSIVFCTEDEPEVKQMLLKVKSFNKRGKSDVSIFSPWTKAELRSIIKDFSNPKENPQRFYEEFRILIGIYDPGLLDLSQCIHVALESGDA